MSNFGRPNRVWLHRSECSFVGIHALLKERTKEYNKHGSVSIYHSNRRNGNYLIHGDSDVACVQHYNTDILQYFKDGRIIVDDYPSSDTRYLIWKLSPISPLSGCRWHLGDWKV